MILCRWGKLWYLHTGMQEMTEAKSVTQVCVPPIQLDVAAIAIAVQQRAVS